MLEAEEQLGRFRINYSLGVGGMGEVYLAEDIHLERKVALKILPAHVAQNVERMQRFTREAKTASGLNHPNIAHIYEIAEERGVNYIAMEFIDGTSLHKKIHGERLELRELLKYFVQIAEGLAKAHAAGIVHRDLKPDNIMISVDGYAKILDFGLAKLVGSPTPPSDNSENLNDAATEIFPQPLSTPGIIMGTAGYMSPEQAHGRREVDQRSDIFSFGSILYEAITRHQPFTGETIIDSLHKIAYSQPPPITDFFPAAPSDLQRIVRRCLQKNPEDRYQTIKDAAIELRELRDELKNAPEAAYPASTRTTADSHGSMNKARTADGGRKTVMLSNDELVHTTSSAEYLVNEIKQHKTGVFVAFAMLAVLIGLGFGLYKFYFSRAPASASAPVKSMPLTSSPEIERNPALSPDGKQIAFAWMSEGNDNYDIYVKIVDAGTPLRLTSSPEREMSPAWSPDGRFIAFLRGSGENKGFYTIPALGGSERKIADAYGWTGTGAQPHALDWSPDGKALAVVDKAPEEEAWSIFLISVDTGVKRRVTTPPAEYAGDLLVAYSPDGSKLAFLRRVEAGVSDIYVMPAEGGEAVPVTRDALTIRGLDWTSDGERIVFSSERAGGYATLWTIAADGSAPAVPVAGTGENIAELSVSAPGNRLVYAQLSADTNLWRAPVSSGGAGKAPAKTNAPAKFISSTRMEEDPQYSSNGKRIAYSSNRSGGFEIWVADGDGQNSVQLTNFNSSTVTGSPSWSVDGRFIAFDSRAEGNADIYIINADGGSPRRLTTGGAEDVLPSWSRDGRFLYFASKRTGRFEIWKMPVTGGEAVQVTRDGGFVSSESLDGRLLYFTKGRSDSSLWSVSLEGGAETKVIENNVGRSWTVAEQGIYFLASGAGSAQPFTIEFFDFNKRQTNRLAAFEKPTQVFAINVAAVSPDRQWVVYAQRDQLDYDMILLENFHWSRF